MRELLDKIENWRPARVIVVGDFMLDEIVSGDAERLSPDAPVPVLQVRSHESRPGGAANVCLDLRALEMEVVALGVTGADAAGTTLREALETVGVSAEGVIADPARPTTIKRSVVGLAQHRHPQKMFRLDVESREPIGIEIEDKLLAALDGALTPGCVVCIEDYAKGVCSERVCREVISRARAAGIPVLVDPAATDDYTRYSGASAITPNRTEAERATGLPAGDSDEDGGWSRLARTLLDDLDLETVVLTLDRHGALVLEKGDEPAHVPTVARQVYDVTGAGGVVLAMLAAARANGLSWLDATRLANIAAGLEVEVFGATPIPLKQVRHELLIQAGVVAGKLRTLDEARDEAEALRAKGRKIVFTNGCFDLLHAGHVSLLRRAARLGDALFIGLNDDDSVRRLKGESRPVHHEIDRADVLSELESVTAVVLFNEDTPVRLIEAIRPDILVKGADYSRETVVGADLVESWGGRVELLPLLDGRSTTAAITRAQAGQRISP
jgi:D-beta-D-heptose 7-phosphate kinase/D-beta-D-heptose 1-phosphate adenosyltransferase